MVGGLGNTTAGFAQAGIVDGDPQQASGTEAQGLLQQRGKESLRRPAGARMQEVLAGPRLLLAAVGPEDAGQGGSTQHQQSAEGLALGAEPSALLSKHTAPGLGEGQEGLQEGHLASDRRAKVFFSVRVKRSPRATFLEREETRLSRSTATPKAEWMRSRMSELWRGSNPWGHHSCCAPEPWAQEKDDTPKSVCQLNNAKTDLRKIDAGEEWIETSPGENVETPVGGHRPPLQHGRNIQAPIAT